MNSKVSIGILEKKKYSLRESYRNYRKSDGLKPSDGLIGTKLLSYGISSILIEITF
jgi:hypothetical protein